ncbi:hypothetical protein TNCV_3389171 [Trichonephila clavipes]|nr:hypothetical protein TNCV_3389171 [Trichonephila clavipes]
MRFFASSEQKGSISETNWDKAPMHHVANHQWTVCLLSKPPVWKRKPELHFKKTAGILIGHEETRRRQSVRCYSHYDNAPSHTAVIDRQKKKK